jgi:nucleotide-binding universal stress UspA family protein
MGRTQDMTTTLLSVSSASERALAADYLSHLEGVFATPGTSTRLITGDHAVEQILAQAETGYDLMVIGAPTVTGTDRTLFGPVIDDLIRLAPCPTLVVRGGAVPDDWAPRRILVPVSGSSNSNNAADLALAIAGPDAAVTGVHVVVNTPLSAIRQTRALDVTGELQQVAVQLGREIATEVRESTDVASGVLAAIEDTQADLLVLGTSVRAGTTHLYLGPMVELLLKEAPCSVIVLNT